jgi:hypothetical protein
MCGHGCSEFWSSTPHTVSLGWFGWSILELWVQSKFFGPQNPLKTIDCPIPYAGPFQQAQSIAKCAGQAITYGPAFPSLFLFATDFYILKFVDWDHSSPVQVTIRRISTCCSSADLPDIGLSLNSVFMATLFVNGRFSCTGGLHYLHSQRLWEFLLSHGFAIGIASGGCWCKCSLQFKHLLKRTSRLWLLADFCAEFAPKDWVIFCPCSMKIHSYSVNNFR